MITDQSTLGQFVAVFRDVVSPDECDAGRNILVANSWRRHAFNHETSKTESSYDDDLDVSYAFDTPAGVEFGNTLMDRTRSVLQAYCNEFGLSGWHGYSRIRYNRYGVGTMMHGHWDAIHTLFDGQHRGVPVLSVVGLLNDDYEGGEFVMFKDTVVNIPKGGVLVFPSSFMYWHEVRTVTKGERFSWVSWAW